MRSTPVSCVGRSVPSQVSSTCYLYCPKSALASLIFPSQFKTVSMRSKKSINALHLVSGVGRSVPSQVSSTWYLYGPESQHALHPVRRVRSCDPSFVFETVPRFIQFVTLSRPCGLLLPVGKRYLSKLLVHKNTKKRKDPNSYEVRRTLI